MIPRHKDGEMKAADPYLEKFNRFDKDGATQEPSWIFPIRKAGIARFAEIGFPTLEDEDWRFTNVQPIAALPFKPMFEPGSTGLTGADLAKFAFSTIPGNRLVFVNGHYAPTLSAAANTNGGVRICSLAAALATGSDAVLMQQHLARYNGGATNAFTALNNAFFQDGAYVHVPAEQCVEAPVHLLFISTATDAGSTAHPRNLIIAGARSRLTVIESYVSVVDGAYVTNVATEFVIGDDARVEHCKFQDESASAFHIASIHSHLGARANFISHSIATGARLSRNNIRTVLAGPGIECVLNGLYLTGGEQLVDHHMIVDHAQPHCASHEYYNGILEGRSKGVFHGRILVRKGAQKTDAKQTNKNLLLSDDATVDTKPQLEIYANDVKCTHGATIGQLDADSIFYLRSRGIGEETARRMLIHAFAGEIIDRVRHEAAREELDQLVWERLEQNEKIAVKKKASDPGREWKHVR